MNVNVQKYVLQVLFLEINALMPSRNDTFYFPPMNVSQISTFQLCSNKSGIILTRQETKKMMPLL